MSNYARSGIGGGFVLSVALLIAAGNWLLRSPETGADVLIAVWLWGLPVLGIGALVGWLAGSMLEKLLQKGTRK
jgi:hypothetical protein